MPLSLPALLTSTRTDRELAQRATPGKWSHEPHGGTIALYAGRGEPITARAPLSVFNRSHGLRLMNLDDGDSNHAANCAHIAAQDPAHTLARCADVEALADLCKRLAEALRDAHFVDGKLPDCDEMTCGTNIEGAPLCEYCAPLVSALAAYDTAAKEPANE